MPSHIVCIITTICLSRLSQETRTYSTRNRTVYCISSFTCKPIPRLSLCVLQSTSYSFASTISTYCSAWDWDHDRHITVYDLSRQRRRSVFLVYIPHEITVITIVFTDHCNLNTYELLLNNEYQTTLRCNVQFRLGLIGDYFVFSLAEFKLPVFPGCQLSIQPSQYTRLAACAQSCKITTYTQQFIHLLMCHILSLFILY